MKNIVIFRVGLETKFHDNQSINVYYLLKLKTPFQRNFLLEIFLFFCLFCASFILMYFPTLYSLYNVTQNIIIYIW